MDRHSITGRALGGTEISPPILALQEEKKERQSLFSSGWGRADCNELCRGKDQGQCHSGARGRDQFSDSGLGEESSFTDWPKVSSAKSKRAGGGLARVFSG